MEGTKAPTAPSIPGLTASDTTDSSVSVSIIPPTADNGADITGYIIQHALASSTTPDNWIKAEISQDDASKPYRVDGLSSGQAVVLRVSAENSVGDSDYSKPYSMVTDEADASAPDKVSDFAVQSTTSNTATLYWTAPADNGAMILRYIISDDDKTYTVDGHDTSYTVTGLSRGSDYTFYIIAKNSKGDSPKSDGVSTKTTESCDADPPSNVMRQTPFSDGLSVSWSKASNPECDLPVTAYRVIDDDGNELCQPATDGALWCDVTALKPSTSYNIRVQAKNSAGWSKKSSPTVKMSTIASGKCATRDQIRWWVTTTNPTYSSMDFTRSVTKCGVKGLGNPDKVASCIVDYTKDPSKTPFDLPPITDDCSMCYGVNGQCAMKKCSFPCGLGSKVTSPECLQCNNDNCVEWLYGKGLSGNRYYLSPESNGRNPVVRIKNTGKKAGPFTDIYRYLAGYAKKPKGPVRYATVYAVSEDSRQTSYKVAVNSHLGRPPCFSEADFIADDNDVLKEINHIGRNGGFQLLKAGHDPHLAGRYFGAMDSERSVELEIEGGVPVNASLTGINSTSLSFMPVDTLFVYAELEDPEKNNLVLPLRGAGESNLRGNKRIFCSNLAEWNSAVDRETSRFDVIMTE
ncbi:immunoglobulin super DCC subclass member [Perkinsus olseni]|uniref:Immunoglobulin super DCC subclass member n=1 Tax=Perkinsus olseni TaxID=32597 RepID=A0A7J6KXA3_PEROL|nr:immunoglobulin super DCC subclass member [Perkinsus olseni]